MTYHRNPETEHALIRLLDSLCTWERTTDRKSTLLLIPHQKDEPIVLAVDGKPLSARNASRAVEIALKERGEITKEGQCDMKCCNKCPEWDNCSQRDFRECCLYCPNLSFNSENEAYCEIT